MWFRTQNPSVKRYIGRFTEVVALLVLVTVLCWVFLKVVDYILPFVVGAFFAMMLLPLVRLLEHRGVHRTAAVITVLVSIVLLLLALSTYVVIAVAREATMWTQTITDQFGLIQAYMKPRTRADSTTPSTRQTGWSLASWSAAGTRHCRLSQSSNERSPP